MRRKSLPARLHEHCDPMCERCCDALNRCEEEIASPVEAALGAFWAVIGAKYPALMQIPMDGLDLEMEELEVRATEAVTYRLFDAGNTIKFASKQGHPR